jgi:hypothetical protein
MVTARVLTLFRLCRLLNVQRALGEYANTSRPMGIIEGARVRSTYGSWLDPPLSNDNTAFGDWKHRIAARNDCSVTDPGQVASGG